MSDLRKAGLAMPALSSLAASCRKQTSPQCPLPPLGLHAGRLNQCGARHDVLADIRIALGRAHDRRIDAEGCQLLPDLRRIQRPFGLAAELLHNFSRGLRRREQPEPERLVGIGISAEQQGEQMLGECGALSNHAAAATWRRSVPISSRLPSAKSGLPPPWQHDWDNLPAGRVPQAVRSLKAGSTREL